MIFNFTFTASCVGGDAKNFDKFWEINSLCSVYTESYFTLTTGSQSDDY